MPYNFHDALKARLALISDYGDSQTTFAKMQAQQRASADQLAQRRAAIGQMASGMNIPQIAGGGGAFDKFKNAIAMQESGGNYNARNPSGAMGKYQIMAGNIPAWSKQALGYSVSTQQFMDPKIQEAVASYHLQRLYNKYGAAGAAVAWYAGEGTAQKWLAAGGGSSYNRGQAGGYPSINRYVQQILQRAGLA